mmetsp:Transcript_3430/g.4927  ORF Transcript_3430/g.4927 Transcript_3430/m.4927 type:complete len:87 (-) Transcript_3430:61-321(-)
MDCCATGFPTTGWPTTVGAADDGCWRLGVGPSTNRMTEDDWQQSVQESTQNQSTANWHANKKKKISKRHGRKIRKSVPHTKGQPET